MLRQQVVYEVFSAYYALQTSTRRVHTAEDLVASAQQSNEVALARYKAGVGSVLDLLAAQSGIGQRARPVCRGPARAGASRWPSWPTTPAFSIRRVEPPSA